MTFVRRHVKRLAEDSWDSQIDFDDKVLQTFQAEYFYFQLNHRFKEKLKSWNKFL